MDFKLSDSPDVLTEYTLLKSVSKFGANYFLYREENSNKEFIILQKDEALAFEADDEQKELIFTDDES